jgi:hypothetical protein
VLKFLPFVLVVTLQDLLDFLLVRVAKSQGEFHRIRKFLILLREATDEDIGNGMLEVVIDDLRNGSIEADILFFLCIGVFVNDV